MEERNFAEDVKLNRFDLDNEAERQATLVQYWTELMGNAYTERSRKEVELKFVESERALYYRRLSDDELLRVTGLKKVTEEAIKQLVQADPLVAQANKELHDAIETYNTYKAAVDAIREKGDMIKAEVSLFIAGYFGDKTRNINRVE